MTVFENTAALIIACAIILLHIITCILESRISKILKYVNIALHIGLIFPMIFGGMPIDEAVLLYMISIFVYTLSRLARGSLAGRGGRDDL